MAKGNNNTNSDTNTDTKNLSSGTALDMTSLPGGYFDRTSRSIYALIYLLPMMIVYELLVLVINPQLLSEPISHVRGGVVAFVWIQNLLHYIGMDAKGAWLAAPLVIVVILIILQITSRQSWKILWTDFIPMVLECIALAIPLIVLAIVLNRPAAPSPQTSFIDSQIPYCQSEIASDINTVNSTHYDNKLTHPLSLDIITGIGAGIYEELVFRLILICGFMLFFETVIGLSRNKAVMISILLSALLFSLHHHIAFIDGQLVRGEVFTITRFAFRAIAGVYFAIIFAVRGFGITAGTHVFYDIIAVLLNAWLFD